MYWTGVKLINLQIVIIYVLGIYIVTIRRVARNGTCAWPLIGAQLE
jgi:hypothetical protein